MSFFGFYATSQYFELNFTGEYLNAWMYVVVSWDDSGNVQAYLNGVAGNTVDVSSISINPSYSFRMMEYNPHCGGGYVDGRMGAMQMWTKRLSSAEILQNFNVHRGRYGV